MDLQDVRVIELPKILDRRGNLSIVEENKEIPFKIKRTYWIGEDMLITKIKSL